MLKSLNLYTFFSLEFQSQSAMINDSYTTTKDFNKTLLKLGVSLVIKLIKKNI